MNDGAPANTNPRVNRYLKDDALDHIDHALGRPAWPLRESYRNYFATERGGDLACAFEASPHWECRNTDGRMAYYRVTQAGRLALAEHLASLPTVHVYIVSYGGYDWNVVGTTPSRARYSYYRDIAESWPDLKFGDFVKKSRVRRAR